MGNEWEQLFHLPLSPISQGKSFSGPQRGILHPLPLKEIEWGWQLAAGEVMKNPKQKFTACPYHQSKTCPLRCVSQASLLSPNFFESEKCWKNVYRWGPMAQREN